jgi:hypothetical protein
MFCSLAAQGVTEVPAELDRYNLVWTTPGKPNPSAMPLGNGEVSISLYGENGDLQSYIARRLAERNGP